MRRRFLPDDKVLVILGSLNSNEADRTMDRSQIQPVQILNGEFTLRAASFFSGWGLFGVSSMAFDSISTDLVYVATETEIVRIDCSRMTITTLGIDSLSDIHEITMLGHDLWIANTGKDEIVRYDTRTRDTIERISLRQFSATGPSPASNEEELIDTFHCNQCFSDMEGNLCALVHHIEGRQVLKRLAQKVLKSQGTGGVLDLRTGKRIPLNLKAPHSVRLCGDQYVVLNSGHSLLQVYDREWRLVRRIDTGGFGRGADFDHQFGFFYAGISATRKRYLDIIPGGRGVGNMVMACSLADWRVVHQEAIEGIEQINNLYLAPSSFGNTLLSLHENLPSFSAK